MSEDNGSDDQPYEQDVNSQYTQIDRNKNYPPPWFFAELMGVAAQRRRSFLLQNQYLTPLTFEYTVFTFFVRYVMLCVSCGLLVIFWIFLGRFSPIAYTGIISAFITIYFTYQWSVTKNTKTVKEEVIFNSLVNSLAAIFAVWTIFDLNAFISWVTQSPFN